MIYLLVKGPSTQIRNLFVASVKESSAGGILADIFLTQEEVDAILAQTSAPLPEGITIEVDKDLIQIPNEEENTRFGCSYGYGNWLSCLWHTRYC